jgi:hypothetical protein
VLPKVRLEQRDRVGVFAARRQRHGFQDALSHRIASRARKLAAGALERIGESRRTLALEVGQKGPGLGPVWIQREGLLDGQARGLGIHDDRPHPLIDRGPVETQCRDRFRAQARQHAQLCGIRSSLGLALRKLAAQLVREPISRFGHRGFPNRSQGRTTSPEGAQGGFQHHGLALHARTNAHGHVGRG